jgi:sporulation protein YlmC with PRC-barrel domain
MFRNGLLAIFGPDVLKELSLSKHRCFHQNYDKNSLMRGDFLKASKINGRSVITADAYELGEVDGTHIDEKTWVTTHLDVDLTSDAADKLGLKKPMLGSVTVSLPIMHIKQMGDVITLNKSLPELENLQIAK